MPRLIYTHRMVVNDNAPENQLTVLCIGAHPDDCEFQCSGTAAKLVARGDRVVLVSMTDGRSGHHEMTPADVVERRRGEAAAGAMVIGAESRVLDAPDGALEVTLERRYEIIRLVRELSPDLIVTNRPNDYHPDHRYTSLLIQDSAYMFMVPHVCPEVPALAFNPVILYWVDSFTHPREIRPDIAVDIDDIIDTKLDMLAAHESQVYEWLPWIEHYPKPVPPETDASGRRAWLREYYDARYRPSTADRFRGRLVERYGADRGGRVVEAEVFELCEYGAQPSHDELEAIFTGM